MSSALSLAPVDESAVTVLGVGPTGRAVAETLRERFDARTARIQAFEDASVSAVEPESLRGQCLVLCGLGDEETCRMISGPLVAASAQVPLRVVVLQEPARAEQGGRDMFERCSASPGVDALVVVSADRLGRAVRSMVCLLTNPKSETSMTVRELPELFHADTPRWSWSAGRATGRDRCWDAVRVALDESEADRRSSGFELVSGSWAFELRVDTSATLVDLDAAWRCLERRLGRTRTGAARVVRDVVLDETLREEAHVGLFVPVRKVV